MLTLHIIALSGRFFRCFSHILFTMSTFKENILRYIRSRELWGFIASLGVIAILSMAFFHPDAMEGNELRQHDMQQGAAIGHEAQAWAEANGGEEPRWTNSLFSGMPTFQISPSYPSDALFSWLNTLYGAGLPSPANLLFMMMAGMLIMLTCMKLRWYYALIGAVAWGFSSYFVIIIGAGHIWKFVTLAYIPPTIGGIILAYRGRWLSGAALAALFAMLQIHSNHVQMTYYFLMVIIGVVLCYLIDAIRRKQLRSFGIATGVLALAACLAVCANLPSLYNTWKYSKESMRGGHTELTVPGAEASRTSGLDRDYITQYSYGRAESLSLLIPDIKGGASARPEQGHLVPTSVLEIPGAEEKAAGLSEMQLQYVANYAGQYFGEPEGTNGPVYVGAVIFALFVLGCLIVKGPAKWVLLALTLLSVFLALGRNMQWFTDLFIDYVPMYSKFRTVESILVIAEFTMPVLAVLALRQLLSAPAEDKSRYTRALLISFGITGAVCLIGWIAPGIFGPAITEADQQISDMLALQLQYAGYPQDMISQLSINAPAIAQFVSEMRLDMVASDSLRSLLFVAAAALALWAALNMQFKKVYAVAAVGLLVLLDLYTVDKRYLSHSSFCTPEISLTDPFPLSANDRAILADTAINYRVMDIPRFAQAAPSYHHKMIGGYHAAKLTRYQDLIDRHLSHFTSGQVTEADMNVLNMLNARYLIDSADSLMVNPGALGNAWFVDRVVIADGPDAEMAALDTINPAISAVADRRFAALAESARPAAPGDTIYETTYAPHALTYRAHTARGGVAVFSEVYFPWGWEAEIDGRPADIHRVNYLLRAIAIPAGDHTITMRFAPRSVSATVTVARTAVIAIYILLLAALLAVLLLPGGRPGSGSGSHPGSRPGLS